MWAAEGCAKWGGRVSEMWVSWLRRLNNAGPIYGGIRNEVMVTTGCEDGFVEGVLIKGGRACEMLRVNWWWGFSNAGLINGEITQAW